MTVSELIEDLDFVLKKYPDSGGYKIAFKDSDKSTAVTTHVIYMDSFNWDEDKEFFLNPAGYEDYYDLKPMNLTVSSLISSLKGLQQKDVFKYEVYAREKVGKTKDGETMSLNIPFNGTGISHDLKTVYFFYADPAVDR